MHEILSMKFELQGNSTKIFLNTLLKLELHKLRIPLNKFHELRVRRLIGQDRIQVPLCCRIDPSSSALKNKVLLQIQSKLYSSPL